MFADITNTVQFQMLQDLQEPQDLLEMKAINDVLSNSSFMYLIICNGSHKESV